MSSENGFRLDSFDDHAKDLFIIGPADMSLSVDWDDVDHEATARGLSKMLQILNDHWNDPAYNQTPAATIPDGEDIGDGEWDKQYEEAKATMRTLTKNVRLKRVSAGRPTS